jgi:hypothetical protein
MFVKMKGLRFGIRWAAEMKRSSGVWQALLPMTNDRIRCYFFFLPGRLCVRLTLFIRKINRKQRADWSSTRCVRGVYALDTRLGEKFDSKIDSYVREIIQHVHVFIKFERLKRLFFET